MKFSVSIIFLILCLKSLPQSYVAFPDSNSKWTVSKAPQGGPARIYSVRGDSLFNSFTYKKYYTVSDTGIVPANSQYYAMIRQDVPGKKVFGIYNNTTIERTLYNFNLNINDTTTVYSFDFWAGPPLKVRVINKDSILVYGQYRKRLELKSYTYPWLPNPEYWIQGIGSSYGLFNSGIADVFTTDVCYPYLLCYKQNGILKYLEPFFNSCFANPCPSTNLKMLLTNGEFRLFPNPVKDRLTFELKENSVSKISIKNCLGQTFYLLNNPISKQEIDMSLFPSGVYYLKAEGESGQKVFKILKE